MTDTTVLEPRQTESHRECSHVAHQFKDAAQQHEASLLGMWAFLGTEVLMFGAMFLSYSIYRTLYPRDFLHGSLDLKWYLGAINTAVLLVSSFFMAMAVHAASLGHADKIVRYLLLTILMAAGFLGIKSLEYYLEFKEHLVPGYNFAETAPPPESRSAVERAVHGFESIFQKEQSREAERAGASEDVRPRNERLFMVFYFIMTGIHATHMLIGIGIMLVLIWLTRRGRFSAKYHNPIELTGLYWHFVDIVWVFLFPLLYLLRNP